MTQKETLCFIEILVKILNMPENVTIKPSTYQLFNEMNIGHIFCIKINFSGTNGTIALKHGK